MTAAVSLVAAGVFTMGEAWTDIVQIALRDEEASHVLLAPVVVGWLLWSRRAELGRIRLRSSLLGPLAIGLGAGISEFGYANAIQLFWHLGAVIVGVGCLVAVTGPQMVTRALPAFVALGFVVPLPGMLRQELALPLQTATATISEQLFSLLGFAVIRTGNVLHYNGAAVAIAEACNGMRMVLALALVSYVLAFGSAMRTGVRMSILLLSPVFAVGCNVIRLLPTVWVYGNLSPSHAELIHELSGWIMLALAFALLLGAVRLLERPRPTHSPLEVSP